LKDYYDRLTTQHYAPGNPALDNAPLARIISQETFAEILALLSPAQLSLVALRLDTGLSFAHVGELIGISQQTAFARMKPARDKILRAYPELASRVWE